MYAIFSTLFIVSANEWRKKLWCIYKMEYYLTVKTERNLTFCDSMDRPGEYYMLSDASQSEKDKYHILSLTCEI